MLLFQTQAADLNKPLAKRAYKGTCPTCHDFNLPTRSVEFLELIIGFSAGQIQLIDPIKHELNKLYNEEVSKKTGGIKFGEECPEKCRLHGVTLDFLRHFTHYCAVVLFIKGKVLDFNGLTSLSARVICLPINMQCTLACTHTCHLKKEGKCGPALQNQIHGRTG